MWVFSCEVLWEVARKTFLSLMLRFTLSPLLQWSQWMRMYPPVSWPKEMCHFHFWLSLGTMNSCQPGGYLLWAFHASFGWGMAESLLHARYMPPGWPLLPTWWCLSSLALLTNWKQHKEPGSGTPPVALSEIRICTTAGRCVYSWSLSHCYSIAANMVPTRF